MDNFRRLYIIRIIPMLHEVSSLNILPNVALEGKYFPMNSKRVYGRLDINYISSRNFP